MNYEKEPDLDFCIPTLEWTQGTAPETHTDFVFLLQENPEQALHLPMICHLHIVCVDSHLHARFLPMFTLQSSLSMLPRELMNSSSLEPLMRGTLTPWLVNVRGQVTHLAVLGMRSSRCWVCGTGSTGPSMSLGTECQ